MMHTENNLTHRLHAIISSVSRMRNDLEARAIIAYVNLWKTLHQLQKAAVAQSARNTEYITPQSLWAWFVIDCLLSEYLAMFKVCWKMMKWLRSILMHLD